MWAAAEPPLAGYRNRRELLAAIAGPGRAELAHEVLRCLLRQADWDQNLLTEGHARYRGPGVMIWPIERKGARIYSQLKSCSSSEVAAMIEELLRHCSTMAVEGHYIDSHGQSEVGFAFCHLLGFRLLPRLKRIGAQRVSRPEPGPLDRWAALTAVLSRPINRDLIGQQYDQMIRYAAALRLGTADTEANLRRVTRTNVAHPTYRALLLATPLSQDEFATLRGDQLTAIHEDDRPRCAARSEPAEVDTAGVMCLKVASCRWRSVLYSSGSA